MNVFKRLLRIGQAEIHAIVDKMEDPIRMTEQGIREMRDDLDNSLEALAKIKALAIRTRNEARQKTKNAEEYKNKTIALLSKAQSGELEMAQAEKLAKEALTIKERLENESEALHIEQVQHEKSVAEMEENIDILKFNIHKWENELKILKARVKVSKATKEVNKQLAQIDSDSTISMLERMKEKVEEDEALAQAYGEMAKRSTSIDQEIDKAIGNDTSKVNSELERIKKELGM